MHGMPVVYRVWTQKEIDMNEFINQFLLGQQACSNGEPCPADASAAFKRGYGAQYELEQMLEHNPSAEMPNIQDLAQ